MSAEERDQEAKQEELQERKAAAADRRQGSGESSKREGAGQGARGPRPASLRRTELLVESLEDEIAGVQRRQVALWKGVKRMGQAVKSINTSVSEVREGMEALPRLEEHLASLEALPAMREAVEELTRRTDALEEASGQLKRLGQQHYEQRVIQPLVRSIFPLYDLVEDADGTWARDGGRELKLTNLLEAIRCGIEEFLAPYGIVPFRHQPGAAFNPGLMQPVKKVEVSDRDLDRTVEESWRAGFRREDRILRHESVVLRVFHQKEGKTGDYCRS